MARKTSHHIIYSGFLTLLTVLVWTATETYHRFSQAQALKIPPAVLAPLEPQLPTDVLENIEKLITIDDLPNPTTTPTITNLTTPTPPSED